MKLRLSVIFLFLFSFFLPIGEVFATSAQGSCPMDDQVETAIGCISTTVSGPGSFFSSVLKFIIGIGGGLALLLMLYGIFIITTSAGMPDKLKEGKEILTSAIAGLVFIILSVFLLNLIGITILGIPGLS